MYFFYFVDSSIHWKMHNAVLSVGVDQLVDCLLTEDAKGDWSFNSFCYDHVLFISFELGCTSPTICWTSCKSIFTLLYYKSISFQIDITFFYVIILIRKKFLLCLKCDLTLTQTRIFWLNRFWLWFWAIWESPYLPTWMVKRTGRKL